MTCLFTWHHSPSKGTHISTLYRLILYKHAISHTILALPPIYFTFLVFCILRCNGCKFFLLIPFFLFLPWLLDYYFLLYQNTGGLAHAVSRTTARLHLFRFIYPSLHFLFLSFFLVWRGVVHYLYTISHGSLIPPFFKLIFLELYQGSFAVLLSFVLSVIYLPPFYIYIFCDILVSFCYYLYLTRYHVKWKKEQPRFSCLLRQFWLIQTVIG